VSDINRIAIEAARAYDVGNCERVRSLYDSLAADGVPTDEIEAAFYEEGAIIANLPSTGNWHTSSVQSVCGASR